MELTAQPLTAEAFAAFGEVIELANAKTMPINGGLTTRFHDLFTVDVADGSGRTLVNVFRTKPLPLPHRVRVMERHPQGSQAFMPLDATPFLVLVARDSGAAKLRAGDLELFITNGAQGVNLAKNTWHHFNIVLKKPQDFIVVDRGGDGNNLEETELADQAWIPKISGAA